MKVLILAASSDIGIALCKKWLELGWEVYGTYRSYSPAIEQITEAGVKAFHCDLNDPKSIEVSLSEIKGEVIEWDALVLSSGFLEPVGLFAKTNFFDWEKSIYINLLKPLQFLHTALTFSRKNAKILFFAGGGTNSAVTHYTGYTLSKVALVKMCEFLSAEMPEKQFVIVGPGWVDTKIHATTINNKDSSGGNFERYEGIKEENTFTSMKDVVDCCNLILQSETNALSGRNISVVYDPWKEGNIEQLCNSNPDLFKLRRIQTS